MYDNYCSPPASTSSTQASTGLQSPITQHAYSPRASPPASAPNLVASYDLPSHARGTLSAAELRLREYSASLHARTWGQYPPHEEPPTHGSGASQFKTRRPSRALASLPPLVHQDTTVSSPGGDNITPPTSYTAHTLPPLDPTKADRTLPSPLPSTMPSFFPLLSDSRSQELSLKTGLLHHAHNPSPQRSQFDALLRASEMARDMDLKDEILKRGGGPR